MRRLSLRRGGRIAVGMPLDADDLLGIGPFDFGRHGVKQLRRVLSGVASVPGLNSRSVDSSNRTVSPS